MLRLVPVMLVAALGVARADDGARVDWVRGLVIADGIGVADRHAPNPAVARGTSRRVAEDAAKRAIAAKLGELLLAAGGKVGDRLKDKAVKARLDQAIDRAIALAAEPETDGAWHVTMAVPIEALRQVIAGPRVLDKAGDTGPPVIVVDDVTVKPAVGWRIGAIDGATVWMTEPPAWAKDAPHVKAKRAKAGQLEVDGGMTATPATLFVLVGRS